MKAHDVAEHILAKIDGLVQSGAVESLEVEREMKTWKRAEAKLMLETYATALDAVTRYAAVEPKERKATGFA